MTRRRVFLLAALAVSGSVALLLVNPAAGPTFEITGARSRCQPSSAPAPAAATLVPDVRYRSVQLCPATPATARTPVKFIDERQSINLVERLGNLPTAPAGGPCPDPAAEPWDLILSSGPDRVTIRLDLGRCDTVSRAGVLRYGATALHRDLTVLIGDGS